MSLIVRVVAPTGRDAELIVALLREHHIAAETCTGVLELLHAARKEPLGPLLLAEECFTNDVVQLLDELVRHQPAWSDSPMIVLTTGGRATLRSRQMEKQLLAMGSPLLLERPIRTETLVSTVRAALRARSRQYQMRDALIERDRALNELRVEGEVLRNSEERFRRLIENAGIGISISYLQGRISYANPTLLRLLGYTAEEIERGSVEVQALTPVEFHQADSRATAELVANGTCPPYQKALRTRDGSVVPFLVGLTLLPAAGGDASNDQVAAFLTDLSVQKQAESALIQSEKLAAVGRLAASISHEINNPLEAVTNLLYLIRPEGLSAQGTSYLSLAERELARVSQIASQTLRFHRQSTRPREVTPEDLIESVVGIYQGRLLNSNIKLVRQHYEAAPVTCYEGDIRQVLNNLVGNAIDSMRGGGRLILRTHNAMNWRTGTPGVRGVRITVADTGHGMDRATQTRIFEAFYTTKGNNGTGLGLWISRGIVEKHHGRLDVFSSNRPPQTGTVFSLFLPRDLMPES